MYPRMDPGLSGLVAVLPGPKMSCIGDTVSNMVLVDSFFVHQRFGYLLLPFLVSGSFKRRKPKIVKVKPLSVGEGLMDN